MLKAEVGLILAAVQAYSRRNCSQLAAAVSYYVLFSIVPLTLLVVSVFGLVIRDESLRDDLTIEAVDIVGLDQGDPEILVNRDAVRSNHGAEALQAVEAAVAALTLAERQQIEAQLAANEGATVTLAGVSLDERELRVRHDNPIESTLQDVAGASGALTALGLLATAWSASAMFGSVRRALNAVWQVDRARPLAWQKLTDLTMVLGFGVLVFASVAATTAIRVLREVSDEALGPLSTGTGPLWVLVPYVVPMILSCAVFTLVYRLVPAASVPFRDAMPGAFIAAILFELMKNGFAFYVANFRAYDAVYGSLGGILLFLTAIYLSTAILLLGATVAARMPAYYRGEFAPATSITPGMPLPAKLLAGARKFARGLFVTDAHVSRRNEDGEDRPDPRQR